MKTPISIAIALMFLTLAATVNDVTYSMIFLGMGVSSLIAVSMLIDELRLVEQEHQANTEGWVDFDGTENPFTVNTEVEYFAERWKHNITQMSNDIIWANVDRYKVKHNH